MNSSRKTKTSSNMKQIRFAETSTLTVTPPKSCEELKAMWYSKHEVSQFKKIASESAKRIRKNRCNASRAYIKQSLMEGAASVERVTGIEHIAGIEHLLSRKVCKILLAARAARVIAVLQEQERQNQQGENNAEILAQVSAQVSVFPKLWRRNIAVMNQAS